MTESLLALPFGLFIGLALGLVGGGGSILTVPVLVYALGEDVKRATTTSLLIVSVTALAGVLSHARSGEVQWRTGLIFAAAGSLGALLGTVLNRLVSPRLILTVFAFLLLAAAWAMARGQRATHIPLQKHSGHEILARSIVAGTTVGALTGFFGVGGGFVIVPALVLVLGMSMSTAVGTSLLVIALTSTVGFAAHLSTGSIDWTTALLFTGGGALGAVIGGQLVSYVSNRWLRRIFAALIVSVAAFLLAKNLVPVLR